MEQTEESRNVFFSDDLCSPTWHRYFQQSCKGHLVEKDSLFKSSAGTQANVWVLSHNMHEFKMDKKPKLRCKTRKFLGEKET